MPRFLSALREALSVSADLVQLKDIAIWGAPAGVVAVVTGFSFDRSWIEIILLLIAAIFVVSLALGFIRASRNITSWYGLDAYSVWAASWLWINCVPRSAKIDETSPAYSSLQKIKGAIQTKKIRVLSGDGGMKSYISREELQKLALDRGESPRFLSPVESKANPVGMTTPTPPMGEAAQLNATLVSSASRTELGQRIPVLELFEEAECVFWTNVTDVSGRT